MRRGGRGDLRPRASGTPHSTPLHRTAPHARSAPDMAHPAEIKTKDTLLVQECAGIVCFVFELAAGPGPLGGGRLLLVAACPPSKSTLPP